MTALGVGVVAGILLGTSVSSAASCFYPREKYGEQRYGWTTEHDKAVPMLNEGKDGKGTCSGTFASDQGHFITATHCLPGCKFENRTDGKPNLCGILIGKNLVHFEVLHPKCTAGGECRTQDDLFVGKPIDKKSLGDFRCLKANVNLMPTEGTVFTIGVPSKTERREGCDSSGTGFYFSDGKITQNDYCTDKDGKKIPIDWNTLAGKDSKIQSTIDIIQGSSGGPLIRSGMIVGVAHAFVAREKNGKPVNDAFRACEGASFFESLNALPDVVRNQLIPENCSEKYAKNLNFPNYKQRDGDARPTGKAR